MALDIKTKLENLDIEPEKIVSILGNLIDNAIFETTLINQKWLNIKIVEENNKYIFEVTNPGKIPSDIKENIFEAGFTTKGDKGTGMGLYIVKNLVKDCNGEIKLFTKDNNITFRVELPQSLVSCEKCG